MRPFDIYQPLLPVLCWLYTPLAMLGIGLRGIRQVDLSISKPIRALSSAFLLALVNVPPTSRRDPASRLGHRIALLEAIRFLGISRRESQRGSDGLYSARARIQQPYVRTGSILYCGEPLIVTVTYTTRLFTRKRQMHLTEHIVEGKTSLDLSIARSLIGSDCLSDLFQSSSSSRRRAYRMLPGYVLRSAQNEGDF